MPGADSETGIRARQREQTASTIERVALELFASEGFDRVTAEDIAAAAGISRRSFFRYFPGGKEDVLLAELRRHMAAVEESMAARPPHEPALTALRASFLEMADRYMERREDALVRAEIIASSPALAARGFGDWVRLMGSLTQMVALRLAADPMTDLRPGIIASASISAVQVAVEAWLRGAMELPAAVETALDIVEAGLAEAGKRLPAAASA